jgi:hypothetical protein
MIKINQIRMKIRRGFNTFKFYTYFSLVLIFVYLGSWCLPPKWFENIIRELKAKYNVEKIIEDDNKKEL